MPPKATSMYDYPIYCAGTPDRWRKVGRENALNRPMVQSVYSIYIDSLQDGISPLLNIITIDWGSSINIYLHHMFGIRDIIRSARRDTKKFIQLETNDEHKWHLLQRQCMPLFGLMSLYWKTTRGHSNINFSNQTPDARDKQDFNCLTASNKSSLLNGKRSASAIQSTKKARIV